MNRATFFKIQNPVPTGSRGKILCADVHRAQQADPVKTMVQANKTILIK